MIASLVFTLALTQAGPTAAVNAATPPAAPADGEIPKGAPQEDYDFVAWCHGALAGHMALYPVILPELKSIERPDEVAGDEKADHEQMVAGREYLALYTRALRAASKSHPRELAARRLKAEAQGEAIWEPAKAAEPRTRMWSWLLWDLPGRCETAARRLEGRSGVLSAALKPGVDTGVAPSTRASPASIDDALGPPPASSEGSSAPPPDLRGPQ